MEGDFGHVDIPQAKSFFKEASLKGNVDGKLYYIHQTLENIQPQDNEGYMEAASTLREILANESITLNNKATSNFYLGFLYQHGLGLE